MKKDFFIIPAISLLVSCGGGTSNQKVQNADSAQVSIVSEETETDTPIGESIIYAVGDINKDGLKDSVSIYGERVSNDKDIPPFMKGIKIFFGKNDGKYSLFKKYDIYSLKEDLCFETDEDYASSSKIDSLYISNNGDLTTIFSVGLDGLSTYNYKTRFIDNDLKIINFEYAESSEYEYSFVCDFLKKEVKTKSEDHCVDSEEYLITTKTGTVEFNQLFSFLECPIGKGFRLDYESEQQSDQGSTYKDSNFDNVKYVNVVEKEIRTNGCDMTKIFKQLDRKPDDAKGQKDFKDEGIYAYYSLNPNADKKYTRAIHSYEFGGYDSGYLVLDFYNGEITAYTCKDNVLTKTNLPEELKRFNNSDYIYSFDDKDGYGSTGHKIEFLSNEGVKNVYEWKTDKFEFLSGDKPENAVSNGKVDLREIWNKIIKLSSEEDMGLCGDCWQIEYHEDAPIPYFEQLSTKGANLGELYCFQVKDGYKIYYIDATTDDGYFLYTFEYKAGKITMKEDEFSLDGYKEFAFIEGGKVFRAWKKTDGFDDYLWNGETLVKK
ncbi:MAG: hypothetical protein IKR41_09510 [Bacteroidales bacterium]|nr:hypothetical protein [Bacteroidales bacterium]